jgi:hypothetical protein
MLKDLHWMSDKSNSRLERSRLGTVGIELFEYRSVMCPLRAFRATNE